MDHELGRQVQLLTLVAMWPSIVKMGSPTEATVISTERERFDSRHGDHKDKAWRQKQSDSCGFVTK